MRLITWNVGHQTHPRDLPIDAVNALLALAPDVLVLTEYVDAPSHATVLQQLADSGMSHARRSAYVPAENQILIVARESMSPGGIFCDIALSASTMPNWLHVRLASGIDIVGFRRPMFKKVSRGVARYWAWLGSATMPLVNGQAVLLGDFNCDVNARCMHSLRAAGWQVATGNTGWSFRAKNGRESAIDHALVSSRLSVESADYRPSVSSYVFAGRPNCYSDHAPLVVDVASGMPMTGTRLE